MKKILITFCLLLHTIFSFGQNKKTDKKFSAAQLKADLENLQQQLYTVHVFPYSELDRSQYDKLFSDISSNITDSLTATAFLKLIKPAIAYLSDEHAQAILPDSLLIADYRAGDVFMPITLIKEGNSYRVDKILSTESGLKTGDAITSVDNTPIGTLLDKCALFVSGYPDQRKTKALMQFGYLYTWALPGVQHSYTIKKANGKIVTLNGMSLKTWKAELNRQTGWDNNYAESISYRKIGEAGYLNACSFNIPSKQLDSIHKVIDSVFKRIYKDDPKELFIDISKNSGGQSVIGRMILDDFNPKPYAGFNMDFKKSEAYIKLLRSWKAEPDDYYKAAPEGKVFHFNADTTFPGNNPYRYKGKVYVIVGNGTFSSAMMMATWIKDNRLATIVGETPQTGHPNGFGELYQAKLPNSKIFILFGVKRWIRPSGKLEDNLLQQDVQVKLTDKPEDLIKTVLAEDK